MSVSELMSVSKIISEFESAQLFDLNRIFGYKACTVVDWEFFEGLPLIVAVNWRTEKNDCGLHEVRVLLQKRLPKKSKISNWFSFGNLKKSFIQIWAENLLKIQFENSFLYMNYHSLWLIEDARDLLISYEILRFWDGAMVYLRIYFLSLHGDMFAWLVSRYLSLRTSSTSSSTLLGFNLVKSIFTFLECERKWIIMRCVDRVSVRL